MPLYFFSLSDGKQPILHSDGIELADTPSAWIEAARTTGEMLRDLNHTVYGIELRMDVADAARKPLFSLRVITDSYEQAIGQPPQLLQQR
jgi:hypothetical protein